MQRANQAASVWGLNPASSFQSQTPENPTENAAFNDPDGLQETLVEGVARSVIGDLDGDDWAAGSNGSYYASDPFSNGHMLGGFGHSFESEGLGYENFGEGLGFEHSGSALLNGDNTEEQHDYEGQDPELDGTFEVNEEENEEDADYQVFVHLQECFPSASQDALAAAVHHSNGDMSTALQIIGDALAAVANCRPCRHKMQGGCYRADCRFDHNLDTTPCRYWIQGYCSSGPENCAFLHDVITAEQRLQLEASGDIPVTPQALSSKNAIAEFPPLPESAQAKKTPGATSVHSPPSRPQNTAANDILQSLFSPGIAYRAPAVELGSSPASGTPSYRDAALRAGSKPEPEAPRQLSAQNKSLSGVVLSSASTAWVAGGEANRVDYEATRARARELAIARNTLYMEATNSFMAGGKAAARDLARRARAIDSEMRHHHHEAARALFGRRNTQFSVFEQGVIDLHGLHIAEAKEVLRELLPELSMQGIRRARVITGSGHHSSGLQQQGRMFAHVHQLVAQELGYDTQEIRDPRGFTGGVEVRL